MDQSFREAYPEDLTGDSLIGAGRYGSVFKALWHANCAQKASEEDAGDAPDILPEEGACPYGLGPRCVATVTAVKRTACSVDEAKLLALVSHKNIVKMFAACVDRMRGSFVVTEFCEEGSLYSVLEGADLTAATQLDWTIQLAKGMNYLHFECPKRVVHRDLKSPNVLVSNSVLKICDFGHSLALTMSIGPISGLVGTPCWMAPESIRCDTDTPITPAVDVWSYGVVIWELLTQEAPFSGWVPHAVFLYVGRNGTLTIPTSAPEPFQKLLRGCWETEPDARPQFNSILKGLELLRTDTCGVLSELSEFASQRDSWLGELSVVGEVGSQEARQLELDRRLAEVELREARLLQREAMLERWLSRSRIVTDGTDPVIPSLGVGFEPFPSLQQSLSPSSKSVRRSRTRDAETVFSVGGLAPVPHRPAGTESSGGSTPKGNTSPKGSPLVLGSGRVRGRRSGSSSPAVSSPTPVSTRRGGDSVDSGLANLSGRVLETPMELWTEADVCAWISILPRALPQLEASFAENNVCGKVLLQLTDAQLRDSLGVTSYGHRAELLAEIDRERKHAAALTAFPPLRASPRRSSESGRQALRINIDVDCTVDVADGRWSVSFKSNPHMLPGADAFPLGATLSGAAKFEYIRNIEYTILDRTSTHTQIKTASVPPFVCAGEVSDDRSGISIVCKVAFAECFKRKTAVRRLQDIESSFDSSEAVTLQYKRSYGKIP